VLLTGVKLMYEMTQLEPTTVESLRKQVPTLVRVLKNLVLSGYAPEHDVNGITDPFLQVALIKLLRVLGTGCAEASDQMNDILAQVATNTESSKNVGNSILYECVLTIVAIEAESGLRVLAINILGRFLANRDNNIRYVALNTLVKVVESDVNAVQRHRATVVECLKDADVSLRRRALELIYVLVNESNVQPLVAELLAYLPVVESEYKEDLVTKICSLVEAFSPDKQWRVDTIIKTLTMVRARGRGRAGRRRCRREPRAAAAAMLHPHLALGGGAPSLLTHRARACLDRPRSRSRSALRSPART
jgi:AP-1 complex subunit gamma-1